MRLADKTAIVTGAGSGFGEGIARRFAQEGARVVIADIDRAAGERVVDAINADRPGATIFVETDVSRDSHAKRMVDAAVESFGGLDVLVNNAGTTHRNKPVLEVTESEFDAVFAVNVKSVFLAARHAVPVLDQRGGGAVLNVASTAGLRPRPGLTWYNASKGAVITASKSMAVELAPLHIRVNALCPVVGQTGMTRLFLGEDTPERRAQFVSTIPLGRMCTPEDVAGAALFLASDDGAFLTGLAMEVDGGRCV